MTDQRRKLRLITSVFVVLTVFSLLLCMQVNAESSAYAPYADAVLQQQCGGDLQGWLNNTLPSQVGQSSADWYALCMLRKNADLSNYREAVSQYLASGQGGAATSKERLALVLAACCKDGEIPSICTEILDQNAEAQGIMSRVFALHLLNNGVLSARYNAAQIRAQLLDKQCQDGGWSVQGNFGDPDVTAMTLQALAPAQQDAGVANAIGRALDFLSAVQLPSGGYQSYGVENPESAAQVWLALQALHIDAGSDARFMKNGVTIPDAILQFQCGDGQFSHTMDGSYSPMATVQVFMAICGDEWSKNNEDAFFVFRETQAIVTTSSSVLSTETSAAATNLASESSNLSDQLQTTVSVYNETTTATQAIAMNATDETTSVPLVTSEIRSSVSQAEVELQFAHSGGSYRIPATILVCCLGLMAAIVQLVRKNKSAKTYLTIAVLTGFGVALVWLVRLESPEEYYAQSSRDSCGTATISIDCSAISGQPDSDAFPSDGQLLSAEEYPLYEGATVLDLLYDATKKHHLQLEVDGSAETAYIRGICSLYEFDFGPLSGWTYTVNGERAGIGCGAYILHDGDTVVWEYTLDL